MGHKMVTLRSQQRYCRSLYVWHAAYSCNRSFPRGDSAVREGLQLCGWPLLFCVPPHRKHDRDGTNVGQIYHLLQIDHHLQTDHLQIDHSLQIEVGVKDLSEMCNLITRQKKGGHGAEFRKKDTPRPFRRSSENGAYMASTAEFG